MKSLLVPQSPKERRKVDDSIIDRAAYLYGAYWITPLKATAEKLSRGPERHAWKCVPTPQSTRPPTALPGSFFSPLRNQQAHNRLQGACC